MGSPILRWTRATTVADYVEVVTEDSMIFLAELTRFSSNLPIEVTPRELPHCSCMLTSEILRGWILRSRGLVLPFCRALYISGSFLCGALSNYSRIVPSSQIQHFIPDYTRDSTW